MTTSSSTSWMRAQSSVKALIPRYLSPSKYRGYSASTDDSAIAAVWEWLISSRSNSPLPLVGYNYFRVSFSRGRHLVATHFSTAAGLGATSPSMS